MKHLLRALILVAIVASSAAAQLTKPGGGFVPPTTLGNTGLPKGCSAGDVAGWNGSVWACATGTTGAISGTVTHVPLYTPDGHHLGDSVITQTGTVDTVGGTLAINTSGQSIAFSSYNGSSGGSNNVWIGGGGVADTTGSNNSAFGVNTLISNTTGTSNTAVGINSLALNTTGTQNSALGGSALTANTTGATNTAMGASALAANTSGSNNTGFGVSALQSNSTGTNNTAVGVNALITNTTGVSNTAMGINALALNSTASDNTAYGAGALELTTGAGNSAFGFDALVANTTGHDNVAFGSGALGGNTVGVFNAVLGGNAAGANTTGTHTIAIGQDALSGNTTGNFYTAIGLHALQDANITDGSDAMNTALGYNTGRGIVTGKNNTIIGAQVTGLAAGLTGQIIIADGLGNQRITVDSSAHTTLAGNLQIMATGATWTSGTGVPAISCARGDRFSRTDGGVGTTDYDCTATNTWTALSSTTGTVTTVGATAPITTTGGTTPTIAISEGNGITNSGGSIVVANGTGLNFGAGLLKIADTAVTPASYTNASITVDQQGRLTAASSGTAPVTSVSAGTGITVTGTVTPTVSITNQIAASSCTYCALTYNAQGQLTVASSGTAPITNGAGNNVVPKSNGTNLVASGIGDDGTNINLTEQTILGHAGAVSYSGITSDLVENYNTSSGIATIAAQSTGGTTEIDLATSSSANATTQLALTSTTAVFTHQVNAPAFIAGNGGAFEFANATIYIYGDTSGLMEFHGNSALHLTMSPNGNFSYSGATPTYGGAGACSSATLQTHSTNSRGVVVTPDTTCTLTFANSGYAAAPVCTASASSAIAVGVTTTATTATFTMGSKPTSMSWHCDGVL